MATEQNKAIMRRLYEEVINTGNLDLADQFVAADVIEHEAFPGVAQGREGFKQFIGTMRAAFPDLSFTVEDMLAEGDRVVSRITIRGTQRGDFMNVAPTGKHIEIGAIDITRFRDGKVTEHWGQTDTLGMMQQLGAIPGQA